jgi:hypothetical protein
MVIGQWAMAVDGSKQVFSLPRQLVAFLTDHAKVRRCA